MGEWGGVGGGDASAFGIIAKSFRATDAFLPDREQRRRAVSVSRGPPLCDVSARPETMALGYCLSTMTNALSVEDGGGRRLLKRHTREKN